MYQTVKDLNIGDTVIISGLTNTLTNVYQGNRGYIPNQEVIWTVAAKNVFAPNTVTLWATNPIDNAYFSHILDETTYEGSLLQSACKQFYEDLPGGIKDVIVPVPLYDEEKKEYSSPEHVSVFSLNEIYSRSEYERHFGESFTDEYYNDEVAVVPPYRTSRDGHGTGKFWTRTSEYEKFAIDPPLKVYEFGHGTKTITTTTKSSGAWPVSQWSNVSGVKPFINVKSDIYVTVDKFFGRYVLYVVTDEDLTGHIKVEGEFRKVYGTKSFHEREWN